MTEQTANIWQEWLKNQEKVAETWKDSFSVFQPKDNKENTTNENPFKNILQEWQSNQEKVLELWKGTFSEFQPDKMMNYFGSYNQLPQNMAKTYENWYDITSKNLGEIINWVPTQVGQNSLEKIFQSTQTYTNLFNFWNEHIKNYSQFSGGMSPQKMQELSKDWMGVYNNVVQSLFSQGLGENLTGFLNHTGELSESYKDTIEGFMGPWLSSYKDLNDLAAKALQGDKNSYMEFLKAWNDSYQSSYGKILRMPALGLNRESSEKVLSSMESYTKYMNMVNEFLASLQKVSYDVMEKLMNKMQELEKEGKSPETFKEFYRIWLDTNEDAFVELFKKDTFAKMLSEMVDSGVDFKKRYEDLLQEMLKNLPIPTNKEMDSLYKAVYELKKEVKAQKKIIAALNNKTN